MIDILGHSMQLQKINSFFHIYLLSPPCLLLYVKELLLILWRYLAFRQQEQEMLTPIIIPLGTVQVPLQSQEPNPGYHQYQLHTQYQVPDMQQLPLSDPRGLNHIPPGMLPPRTAKYSASEHRDEATANGTADAMMGPQNPAMGPQVSVASMTIKKT